MQRSDSPLVSKKDADEFVRAVEEIKREMLAPSELEKLLGIKNVAEEDKTFEIFGFLQRKVSPTITMDDVCSKYSNRELLGIVKSTKREEQQTRRACVEKSKTRSNPIRAELTARIVVLRAAKNTAPEMCKILTNECRPTPSTWTKWGGTNFDRAFKAKRALVESWLSRQR